MTHVAEEAKNSEIVKQQKASPDINVFTGEKFGEDSGDNGLDMNSLFSVDEDALQKAFSMGDTDLAGSLGNSLDFSKAVNLQDAFKLDVKVKPGGMCKADHEKVFFKDSKGEWKSNYYRRKGTEASDRYHAGV